MFANLRFSLGYRINFTIPIQIIDLIYIPRLNPRRNYIFITNARFQTFDRYDNETSKRELRKVSGDKRRIEEETGVERTVRYQFGSERRVRQLEGRPVLENTPQTSVVALARLRRQQCRIAAATSKRLVKQALNDCSYLDIESVAGVTKREANDGGRERLWRKKREAQESPDRSHVLRLRGGPAC